jgi:hypothetical protein
MKLILSLLALALLPVGAQAACTLNYKELKSAIDVARSEVRAKTKVRYSRSERSVSQTITMLDGQAVRYKAGGCEHYTYSFAYPSVKMSHEALTDFARAAELLASTPVTKQGAYDRDMILTSLRAAVEPDQGDGSTHYFPCGDANCYVSETEAGEFIVTYSFAL